MKQDISRNIAALRQRLHHEWNGFDSRICDRGLGRTLRRVPPV